MLPEGAPRERRSRLASVRRSAARAPRAAALLRPGPYRTGWLVVLVPAFVLLVGARTAPALPRSSLPADVRRRAGAGGDERGRGPLRRSLPGSAGDRAAAAWVAERLRAAGADVSIQHFRAADANGRTVPMINVLGVVTGNGPLARRARVHRRAATTCRPAPARTTTARAPARSSSSRARWSAASRRPRSCSPRSTARPRSPRARASSRGIRRAACACAPASRCAPSAAPAAPLVLRLSGEGHRLPAAGWLRTVEQALRDEDVAEVRLPSLGQQVAALVAPVAHGDQARARRHRSPPSSASTARGRARARRRHAEPLPGSPALCRPPRPRRHRGAARRARLRHRAATGQPRLHLPRLERPRAARLDARALPRRPADPAGLRADRRRGAGARPRRASVDHGAARALAGGRAWRSACSRSACWARPACCRTRTRRRLPATAAAWRCGRSCSRSRSAAPAARWRRARVPVDADTRRRRALPRRARLAARRRGARVRGQRLPARARDPRPARLAAAPRHRAPRRRGARRGRAGRLARARPP